jgi:hypothetical protein
MYVVCAADYYVGMQHAVAGAIKDSWDAGQVAVVCNDIETVPAWRGDNYSPATSVCSSLGVQRSINRLSAGGIALITHGV